MNVKLNCWILSHIWLLPDPKISQINYLFFIRFKDIYSASFDYQKELLQYCKLQDSNLTLLKIMVFKELDNHIPLQRTVHKNKKINS